MRKAAIVMFLCAIIAPLRAHHSAAAIFDMSRPVSVTGTLTRVDWINPHVVIAVEAKGAGGTIQPWTFQSNPPSWYRSVGLARADLERALGATVTVEGVRARTEPAYGFMQRLKLPDGATLNLFTAPGR